MAHAAQEEARNGASKPDKPKTPRVAAKKATKKTASKGRKNA